MATSGLQIFRPRATKVIAVPMASRIWMESDKGHYENDKNDECFNGSWLMFGILRIKI